MIKTMIMSTKGQYTMITHEDQDSHAYNSMSTVGGHHPMQSLEAQALVCSLAPTAKGVGVASLEDLGLALPGLVQFEPSNASAALGWCGKWTSGRRKVWSTVLVKGEEDWANDLARDQAYESMSGIVPRGKKRTEQYSVALDADDGLETGDENDMTVLMESVLRKPLGCSSNLREEEPTKWNIVLPIVTQLFEVQFSSDGTDILAWARMGGAGNAGAACTAEEIEGEDAI
ncbi:hypothetical protein BKA70DRAFT_1236761 [Coprinopsis sp. MPI-PUGE-AT-0042]|nr:hypothetical protein BKA70DRAFT_1236761 [Coprinopsis sp. MPI-PUGE-AT-0042]